MTDLPPCRCRAEAPQHHDRCPAYLENCRRLDRAQERQREAREQAAAAERERAAYLMDIYKIEDAAAMLRKYGEDELAEQVRVAAGRLSIKSAPAAPEESS